jgi:peptidoglycan hydrolase CwlO-like protein
MLKFRIPLIIIFILLLTLQGHSAPPLLSSWVTLRSDSREQVKKIIHSEVDSREGFSAPQEEKANLNAVEDEKEKEDTGYKKALAAANKEFTKAKKRRDDLTTQFQAVSTELEDQQKNIKTIKTGIENLDSQIDRYSQDIKSQQDALKKWLQTEKQGEALAAVIYTRGFKDAAHTLESIADQASAPLMAQLMGTYIQSFTKVINSVLSVDFIRAIEEGTAKWNTEEPLRIELEKGSKGTTYLRLKRYELYPFQNPKGGRVKPAPASKYIKASVITTRKELDDFLKANGYSSASYDLDRANNVIKETSQMNTAAEESLQEQVRSFRERINSVQEKITSARLEKETQLSLMGKKEEPYNKTLLDVATVQSKKEEADRLFQETQKALHDIRRMRESIIIKTALTTARGSESPAEVSAEAIIDKLAEVKNDAKTQHSSSTTEVTNFQVSAESSSQAVTEAHITAVRLISFINEGDSVRVRMAFRVRTLLEEPGGEAPREKPQPVSTPPAEKKFSRLIPSFTKPPDEGEKETLKTPEPEKVAPEREPVKRNPKALGVAEANDVLFEVTSVKLSGNDISVFVDMTNMSQDSTRNIAIYDERFRWSKSKLTDTTGKEYEVSQVVFWKEQQKTSMYDAGTRGIPLDAGAKQAVQLIFKNVSSNLKTIKKLTIHPFIYWRIVFVWKWQEHDLAFQNLRVSR